MNTKVETTMTMKMIEGGVEGLSVGAFWGAGFCGIHLGDAEVVAIDQETQITPTGGEARTETALTFICRACCLSLVRLFDVGARDWELTNGKLGLKSEVAQH